MTGIMNVVKTCPGTEILTCGDGQQVNRTINWGTCSYDITALDTW